MAYAALTSLACVIDQILPHEQRYISLCGKDQMESLHEKVCLLQEFLEHISSKPPFPALDALESRIKDTAYKMEDTIELELVILTETDKDSESCNSKSDFSCYFEDVGVLFEEAIETKKIVDNSAIQQSQYSLTTTTLLRETPGSKGTRVGLDKALNQILDQVIGQKSRLRIVPITGMGGIGKTTLARAAYEAPQTLRHFDVRYWVTVSQDYNIQQILRGFLHEANQPDERLIEYVHKHLTGRRYLIVLDDMWDEKVWDQVRAAFPDKNHGSCVILTTRSSRVASYVGSSSTVHEMQFLNEDQSWNLLREKVYGHESCSTEFEDMGRMIAKNCKGLPLAIVVIAGLLKFNKARDYWEQVARNTDEKVTTSNDHLFEILLLSYTRLPPHLKACFLYMGVYKEDYEIPTNELVMLWVAEGFLKPKQSRSMEEVAEECLEELAERSLILVTKRWYSGKIKTLNVQNVIREMSIRKAEEEKFHYHFTESVDESTFRNVLAIQHRVSITDSNIANFPLDTTCVATRSLIEQNRFGYGTKQIRLWIIQSFKLLRVLLYRSIVDVSQLSSFVCTRINLRYLHLGFRNHDKIWIPNSLSKLQNLETLIVSAGRDTLFVFPTEIWKLQRLRHIIVEMGVMVWPVPRPNEGCAVLSNLQTLSGARNVNFTKRFVDRIPNVKKLKLIYTKLKKEWTMENLQHLHQLEELSVSCDRFNRHQLTNFVFPNSLIKLSLYDTRISKENLSPIGLLPNLKVLKLKADSIVMGEEWEPIEGEFLQLEQLNMFGLSIRFWRAESYHFPCLRKLVITYCYLLEEIPESIGEMEYLEILTVKHLGEEAKRSVQNIKEDQEEMCNELLQVNILLDSDDEGSDQ